LSPLSEHTVAAVMRALGLLPQEEIARLYGISLRSVQRIAARARQQQLDTNHAPRLPAQPRCPGCGLPLQGEAAECGRCRAERDRADRQAVAAAIDTFPREELSRINLAALSPTRRAALYAEQQAEIRRARNRRRRGRAGRYQPEYANSFHP